MEKILVQRSDKISFMKVGESINRMQGFTAMTINKNIKEYTRQYVDENFEQSDATGYSPSMECGFDQYKGDVVHDMIVEMIDAEVLGSNAIVEIYTIDLTKAGKVEGNFLTSKRQYSLQAGTEGDSMDAYTYSFTLKTKSKRELGEGKLSEDELTLTYTTPTPEV